MIVSQLSTKVRLTATVVCQWKSNHNYFPDITYPWSIVERTGKHLNFEVIVKYSVAMIQKQCTIANDCVREHNTAHYGWFNWR